MKVLIPMAGEGSRFAKAGYTMPKPLIDVKGKPMIQWVIENLKFPNITEYIFIVRKEHIEKYNIDKVLKRICGDNVKVSVVSVDRLLKGSAMSILEARDLITYEDLLVANSDQFIEYSKDNFRLLKNLCKVESRERGLEDIYSLIFTFYAVSSKWSFVRLDKSDRVVEVAEKNPISNIANCGVFYFSNGLHLVDQLDKMISADFTVNDEYYLAPSYNFQKKFDNVYPFFVDKMYVYPFFVDKMWGLGTPEDLEAFLDGYHFS